MSLFQLNTPAFPASRTALLTIGTFGLVILNVLVVFLIGGYVHHHNALSLNWLLVAAVLTAIGIPLARFAATLLWHWVAGTTALNGPGHLFAKSAAGLGPCILAVIGLYVIATGKYVGAHIPMHLQGLFGVMLAAIAFLGVIICLQELKASINKRRATA